MKLLMVTNFFDSHSGGIERVAGELFRRLAGKNCELTWGTAAASSAPEPIAFGNSLPLRAWNGVERVIGLPLPVPSLSALYQLWNAVGRSQVVLIHDCIYFTNIAAFIFARLRRRPALIIQHLGIVPYSNPALAMLMKAANFVFGRPMLRTADQVFFISHITRKYFDALKFKRPPVLIFNGVDTNVFSPLGDRTHRVALRARFQLPQDKSVILFVGRFVEKKGLKVLFEMVQTAPDLLWAFAGNGPIDPRTWRLSNVQVYSGLHHESLAELYRAVDLFLLPSRGEGFPLVLQEALACGLPCVCAQETLEADEELAKVVRGVPLFRGNIERSAQQFLIAAREELRSELDDKTKTVAERHAFVDQRYSWRNATNEYLRIFSSFTKPQ